MLAQTIDTSMSDTPASKFHLYHEDVLQALDRISDNSIDLVLTSPPYNIGKAYEKSDRRTVKEYQDWCADIIHRLDKKIKDTGTVCWQVGNYVDSNTVLPLDYLIYPIFAELGYKLRNRIIWQFNFGLHARQRLSGRYETLLWLTKSDDYVFNLEAVRVPQLYPGKRHSSTKGIEKAGRLSGNPKGKNPSDYWEFSGERFFRNDAVWQLPNVKANHLEHTSHPCQFPVELAERCVLAFTNDGDSVLDPFIGSGTTAVAALARGRNAIGIDRDADYIALAKSRIDALRRGDLPVRKAGMGVRRPRPTEKVAQVPEDWNGERDGSPDEKKEIEEKA